MPLVIDPLCMAGFCMVAIAGFLAANYWSKS
jgi:hypothetical protein